MIFAFIAGVAFAAVEVATLGGRSLTFEIRGNVRKLKQMIEKQEGTPADFINIMHGADIKGDDDILDSGIGYNFNMVATIPSEP